jgi:mannose-1-phosphate guanylyltransferase/mannose-6-phosphate isomerase
LSGGSGTRLWPLSRKLFPKQHIPLLGGEKSLLQVTAERIAAIPGIAAPMVVTNEQHRFMVASQLFDMGIRDATIILEPEGKNTAPAIAVAALHAQTMADDPELLILPADHYVAATDPFVTAIVSGRELAGQGRLVTFGIVPDKPETGYGYIKKQAQPLPGHAGAFHVARFVEKPDLARARAYLEDGNHLWNSGMFLFTARTILAEFERFTPDILAACREALTRAAVDLDFLRLDRDAFCRCPSDSIDYAVMEKTEKCDVVALECGWSDVGSWTALHEVHAKDDAGNVTIGDIVTQDTTNCYLHATSRLITALGLSDIIIVETKDAILAASRDKIQDVKKIVAKLKEAGRPEADIHRKVYRPWGNYEGVDMGDRFQVKRIIVYPGQTLSLQKHHHRAEHWVVVKGTAIVTKGTEEILLTEDKSIYIPLGEIHRLHNPGKVNLELIEIQTGSYLGEDDIVRMDDIYGR